MLNDIVDMPDIPVRVFVTTDPGGYYLEFDHFLLDERNRKILSYLSE
jgi:hypothetical protein